MFKRDSFFAQMEAIGFERLKTVLGGRGGESVRILRMKCDTWDEMFSDLGPDDSFNPSALITSSEEEEGTTGPQPDPWLKIVNDEEEVPPPCPWPKIRRVNEADYEEEKVDLHQAWERSPSEELQSEIKQ